MFECDFPGCDKVYPKLWRLKEHQCSSHTGNRPFVCLHPGCDKTFIRSYHLKRHVLVHDDKEKPLYKCTHPGCERAYALLQSLRKHEKLHRTPCPYKCDVPGCSAEFNKHSKLAFHKAELHGCGDKPFKCTYAGCTRAFISQSNARRHLKSHKEYPCTICSHRSVTWSEFRLHITQQHPPTCSICGQKFVRLSQLNKHRVTHNETREVFCCEWKDCTRIFTTLYNLEQHVLTFHRQEKPYVCSHQGCTAKYTTKQSLARHVKKAHSNVVQPSSHRPHPKRPLSSRLSGYWVLRAEEKERDDQRMCEVTMEMDPQSQGDSSCEVPKSGQQKLLMTSCEPME